MTLDIGLKFNLKEVITASELLQRLLDQKQRWTFEELHQTANALQQTLEKEDLPLPFQKTLASAAWRRFREHVDQLNAVASDLEAGRVSLKEADTRTTNQLPDILMWSHVVDGEFRKEMDELLLYQPDAKRQSPEKWYDISQQLGPGNFDRLPLAARLSFREAGYCFLFEQFTAAAVMSLRAAEAMLREYFYRQKLEEPKDTDGWKELVDGLPTTKETLKASLDDPRKLRNELMHPRSDHIQGDPTRAEDCFFEARQVVHSLLRDLQEDKRLLSVAVCVPFVPELPGGLSLDLMIALWLLQNYGGGIGRLLILDSDRPNFVPPRPEDFDYLLGSGSKSHDLPPGDSFAYSLAIELKVAAVYSPLLAHCRNNTSLSPDVELAANPEATVLTIEGLVRAIQKYHRNLNPPTKAEVVCGRVFQLLDQVVSLSRIQSFNATLDEAMVKSSYKREADSLREHLQQVRTRFDSREVRYKGLEGIVAQAPASDFRNLVDMFRQKDSRQVVALTDGEEAIWIEAFALEPSLAYARNVLDRLLDKPSQLLLEKGQSSQVIRERVPVRLTVNQLFECMNQA